MSTQLITIAQAKSPHGIKGACKLHLIHYLGHELKKEQRVSLFPQDRNSSLPEDGKDFVITNIIYGHKVMLSLSGVEDRNALLEILPFELKVEREAVSEDNYADQDLVGFSVIDHQSKGKLGKVTGVYFNGAQSVLEIGDGLEIDLVLNEIFVPLIDFDKRIIEIIPPSEY